MKWLKKLKTDGLEESKLGKRVATKIEEYNNLKAEIEELELQEDEIEPDSLAEFKDDLQSLRSELEKIDDKICVDIDKYVKNSAAASERFKKMHENKKAQKQVAPLTGTQSVSQPAQVAAKGALVEEEEKKEKKPMGLFGWLGIAALTVVSVAVGVNFVKNRN
jgi:predicted phage tail protein